MLTKKQKANLKRAVSKQVRQINRHFKTHNWPLDYYKIIEEVVEAVIGPELQLELDKALIKAQLSLCFVEGKPFTCILPAKTTRVGKNK